MGVIVLDLLDATAVRRWSRLAGELLEAHRTEIDALNVFPVPDSDTGTNLLLTLRAGGTALAEAGPALEGAGAALAALASGAAQGAVGNSGFIVSQVLRGLAEAAAGREFCGGVVLADGLDRGVAYGRAAVVVPVEGTVLTVARAAADGALSVVANQPKASAVAAGSNASAESTRANLAAVIRAALAAAASALAGTTAQLAELTAAGVVDAGGRGLLVVLDALAQIITGDPSTLRPAHRPARAAARSREVGSGEYGFEVQYLLDAAEPAVTELRAVLAGLGDSVAVVPTGPEAWNVHVHVNDVGAAIEAGVEAGRPRRIAVVRFTDPHDRADTHDHAEIARSAVVAVAPGAGLAHLFESEGVRVVDRGGGAPPSTQDVVEAIHATGATQLILLPNASQVTGVAEAAANRVRAHGLRVSVVPTRSPVQGLAAIAVHDADRTFDDDVVAMAEAAAATRFAELTIASSEALTAVGICSPGDVLGLIDGEVVEIGRGLLAVSFTLVDRLLGIGAELITVLVGADAPRRAGPLIEEHVRARAPFTDVNVYEGGQPDHPVIIGAE